VKGSDQDLRDEVAALRAEVAAFRQYAEKVVPELHEDQLERQRVARYSCFREISEMPVGERVEQLARMSTTDRMHYWGGIDPTKLMGNIVETLKGCNEKLQLDLIASMPDALQEDLAYHTCDVPRFVRVTLAPRTGTSVLYPAPIRGVTRAEDYEGLMLDKSTVHTELASLWAKRLVIDATLRTAVESGQLEVVELSDAENRERFRQQQRDKPTGSRPEARPRIVVIKDHAP
jgi:hypothetical protein